MVSCYTETELSGTKSGKLIVSEIHDYATVFLMGIIWENSTDVME